MLRESFSRSDVTEGNICWVGALAPPASNINVTYVTPMVTQIRNCGVAGWSGLPLESYSRGGWVGGGMPMLPSVTFDRLNDSLRERFIVF